MLLADSHSIASSLVCLMIGAAGWYYLFYSRAAHRLSVIEPSAPNRRRVLLRRTNGVVMILLAGLLYFATQALAPKREPGLSTAVLLAIVILLGLCVTLAWIDMRMTMDLRNRRDRDRDGKE